MKVQSTLQLAAGVLKFLEAGAAECQLELSCHSLRYGKHPFNTWPLVTFMFSIPIFLASKPSLFAVLVGRYGCHGPAADFLGLF
jgi:hypothetical protein